MPAASILAARLTKALDPLQLGKVTDNKAKAKAAKKDDAVKVKGRRRIMGYVLSGIEGRHSFREPSQVHPARTTFLTWIHRR